MSTYRRTWQITDIDWTQVFRAYEARFDCAVDYAVDMRGDWYRVNHDVMGYRLGGCTVYYRGGAPTVEKFRDEILSELGITLGYAEVTSGD